MPLSLLDISNSLKNANVCLKVPSLQGGHVSMRNNHPIVSSGGYCVVYKYEMPDHSFKALRIWHKDLSVLPDIPEVAKEVSSTLSSLHSSYFINYDYYPKGILVGGDFYPIVVMDWCEGEDLKDYITSHIEQPDKLLEIAKQFKEMVSFFHKNSISHGDLQHGNIRIREDGSICVLDYDSMYVPALKGKKEFIKGLPSFQHPTARDANEYLNPKVDFFSECVIYLSLLLLAYKPELWTEEVKRSDDILLFDNDDLMAINTPKSKLFEFRNVADNGIFWLFLSLQKFLRETDLNCFTPLEKIGSSFLPGDPTAHKPSNPKKERGVTESSTVDVKDILKTLKL